MTPIVETDAGRLEGLAAQEGVVTFLGIDYAAAPFGDRRFMPPQPVTPWAGVRRAVRFGPTVPKSRLSPHLERMFPERWIDGEDCLNLNIWAPAQRTSLSPVLVWIHGGGFTNGSSSSPEFDGSAFARDGIVCVTINYRVGADGFLNLGDGITNVGLQDQLAALDWVQRNISAFGGDPGRVTLAGHSAGGSSVLCLLASPASSGLFSRAISQSTSGIHRLTSPEVALQVGLDLAARLDVAPTRAALADVPLRAFLAAVDHQLRDLATGTPESWGSEARTMAPWAPTMDGVVIPRQPVREVAAGRGRSVPLLTGTTRDEVRIHLTPEYLDTVTEQELGEQVSRYGLTASEIAPYRASRPGASPGDLLAAVAGDWHFRIPTVRLAEARHRGGAADTWMYRFDRPLPEENDRYGAGHGADVPFVFDTIAVDETHPRIGPRPSSEVAEFIHRLWVDFINGHDPCWPAYRPDARTTALLSDTLIVAEDPDGCERTVWSDFFIA